MPDHSALIIDDERLARHRIARFLQIRKESFDIHECKDGLAALQRISVLQPDLVFLDMEMPGLRGMEVLKAFPPPQRSFQLIFQTAFDEFAIQAFDENACDYLLKPFDEGRFHQATDRALEKLRREHRKIKVEQGKKTRFLKEEEIHYFISQDHMTCVMTNEGEALCEGSLAELEKSLDPSRFARIHRKCIVNRAAIRAIHTPPRSPAQIELINGDRLPLSRRNRRTVLDAGFYNLS